MTTTTVIDHYLTYGTAGEVIHFGEERCSNVEGQSGGAFMDATEALRIVAAGEATFCSVCVPATSATVKAELEAQPVPQPGEEGWWRIWGAMARHIEPGDVVLHNVDGEVQVDLIQDTYLAKNAPLRLGVVVDGERCTFGALTEIVLMRRGTRNTLAR